MYRSTETEYKLTGKIGTKDYFINADKSFHGDQRVIVGTEGSVIVKRLEVVYYFFRTQATTHVVGKYCDTRCQAYNTPSKMRQDELDVGIPALLSCDHKVRRRFEGLVRDLRRQFR